MPHGEQFASVEEVSMFDEFDFLSPEIETRYSHSVRTRTLLGTQEDVGIVRLYRHQHESGFEQVLGAQLDDWNSAKTSGVVGLQDWGSSPRPWVVAEATERTLWERGQLSPTEALRTARDLTATLARLHQRDKIHGGIDPHSIRFTPAIFTDRSQPLFDNVGLIPIYWQFDNPASYTDPRYAAPEYFTAQHGNINHSTDIYQLGMALYSAFTGSPPYEGNMEEIQRQVLRDRPLGMSPDNPDLPGPISTVLAKATARQKIARYETATQFHSAVTNICEVLLE
jgi:serine/threonine protein kinase